MTDKPDLLELNKATFVAEAKQNVDDATWDAFLWSVLADDFRIKRANPALLPQDKRQMIAHIQYDVNPPRREVAEEKMFEDDNYGVVTCVVTLEGRPGRFHNLKVFTRQPGGAWQCVYWRVSLLPS